MRYIGEMAEHLLSMWCTEAGLTVNKADSDKMGWDHFIEFPLSNVISSSQIHHSAPKCKIQVKATDNQNRKVQVTLSNLYKMAIDPIPFFFLFVEYDQQNLPQKVFLRLVDNNLIYQILKKVHKINASPKENKFNKKTMVIKYDESHLLKESSGSCLKTTITTFFDGNYNKFINDRIKYIEAAGYESGSLGITFNTAGEKNLSKLINVSLGLENEVPIEELIAVDKRFGISTKLLELPSNALLSMPNIQPSHQSNITFKNGVLGRVYSFPVDIYFPPFFKKVTHKHFKSRFKSGFFDLVLEHYTKNVNFKFNFKNESFDFLYFREAIDFISDLSQGNNFTVSINGEETESITLGVLNSFKKFIDYKEEKKSLFMISEILRDLDYRRPFKLSFDELIVLKEPIIAFHSLLFLPSMEIRVSFNIDDGCVDFNKEYMALGYLQCLVGDLLFTIFYTAKGQLNLSSKITSNRYAMLSKNINLEHKYACNKALAPSDEEIQQELKVLEKKYPNDLVVVQKI